MAGKIASILRAGLASEGHDGRLSGEQSKACKAILRCRTGELGYLQAVCGCGYSAEIPCSCRNRHCPECQSEAAQQWRHRYQSRLPDVPAYHGVFTVPEPLRYFFRARPREMYSLLFRCVHQTLQRFSRRDRRLQGARLGLVGVLHTWGSQMQFHPHLHLLICGGGFTATGEWRSVDPRQGYLFSRQALACVFRGVMLEAVEQLIAKEPEVWSVPSAQLFSLLRRAALKPWGVFLQRSRSDPWRALAYLSRYTHRVAISPSRILAHQDGQVLIAPKKTGGTTGACLRLSVEEFLRRFLQHVLPGGFRKIRAYGFLHSGWQEALARARSRRETPPAPSSSARACPHCQGLLRYLLIRPIAGLAPP